MAFRSFTQRVVNNAVVKDKGNWPLLGVAGAVVGAIAYYSYGGAKKSEVKWKPSERRVDDVKVVQATTPQRELHRNPDTQSGTLQAVANAIREPRYFYPRLAQADEGRAVNLDPIDHTHVQRHHLHHRLERQVDVPKDHLQPHRLVISRNPDMQGGHMVEHHPERVTLAHTGQLPSKGLDPIDHAHAQRRRLRRKAERVASQVPADAAKPKIEIVRRNPDMQGGHVVEVHPDKVTLMYTGTHGGRVLDPVEHTQTHRHSLRHPNSPGAQVKVPKETLKPQRQIIKRNPGIQGGHLDAHHD